MQAVFRVDISRHSGQHEEKSFTSRRAHTKSRKGCVACKKRRIKVMPLPMAPEVKNHPADVSPRSVTSVDLVENVSRLIPNVCMCRPDLWFARLFVWRGGNQPVLPTSQLQRMASVIVVRLRAMHCSHPHRISIACPWTCCTPSLA